MTPAKLRLKPIHPPEVWRADRWPWEETGEIRVLAVGTLAHETLNKVADVIRQLLQNFALPVRVFVDGESRRREHIIQCINEIKREKQLDNQLLVTRINQRRPGSRELRPGLVILLNPDDFEPFKRPGETQPGLYGTTHDDGVCLLRAFHEEAVRHELAHMLGLGEHCDNSDCLMRWECPTSTFCPLCVAKIEKICQIESA